MARCADLAAKQHMLRRARCQMEDLQAFQVRSTTCLLYVARCHCKPSETLLVRLYTRTGRRSCWLMREPGSGRTCHSTGVPDSGLVCDSVLLKSRWSEVTKLLTSESQREVLQKHLSVCK